MADSQDVQVLAGWEADRVQASTRDLPVKTRREVLRAVARRLSAEADRLEEDWG